MVTKREEGLLSQAPSCVWAKKECLRGASRECLVRHEDVTEIGWDSRHAALLRSKKVNGHLPHDTFGGRRKIHSPHLGEGLEADE